MAHGHGRRGSAKSGEAGGALGRVGSQGGRHAHLGLAGTQSLGGKTTYDGARRWPAVTAAVAAIPARGAHGLGNKRC
jgi:hypothetical protein